MHQTVRYGVTIAEQRYRAVARLEIAQDLFCHLGRIDLDVAGNLALLIQI
jgi:hypothetical protein